MQETKKEISRLRRPFVAAGGAVGAVLSGWYLYKSSGGGVPHPVWTRFVNVALIMFVSIYAANLLRRLVESRLKRR